jgi:hypothetical protein
MVLIQLSKHEPYLRKVYDMEAKLVLANGNAGIEDDSETQTWQLGTFSGGTWQI